MEEFDGGVLKVSEKLPHSVDPATQQNTKKQGRRRGKKTDKRTHRGGKFTRVEVNLRGRRTRSGGKNCTLVQKLTQYQKRICIDQTGAAQPSRERQK